jgi:hypothetical protein
MSDFGTAEDRRQELVVNLQSEMSDIILRRRKEREYVTECTTQFVQGLFGALRQVSQTLRDQGLHELGEPRLVDHPAGNGLKGLQVPIEDWSVIFVPLVGNARPNIRDEAQIPPMFFKQIAGRVAVFIGNEPTTNAFYDFLILPSGAWFAWGYGWPRQANTIEETDFELLAYGLLSSFIKDIFVTWRTREETSLGAAMDARRRAYLYGLPGDDT